MARTIEQITQDFNSGKRINTQEFGQMLKTKYPQYGSMSDEELGKSMLNQYPQYGDRVSNIVAPLATQPKKTALQKIESVVTTPNEMVIGAVKSAIRIPQRLATAGQSIGSALAKTRFGKQTSQDIRNIAGYFGANLAEEGQGKIGQALSATQQASLETPKALEYKNKAQEAGAVIEQIAEFFVPTPASLAKGAQVAKLASKLGTSAKIAKFLGGATRIGTEALGEGAVAVSQSDLSQFTPTAGLSAALQVGLAGLGKIPSTAARFTNRLVARGSKNQIVEEIAKKYNITLPASSLTDNAAVELVESMAAKGAVGRRFAETVNKAIDDTFEIGQKLLTRSGGAKSAEEAGNIITKGIDVFEQTFRKRTTDLYDKLPLGKGGLASINIVPEQTRTLLRSIVDDLKLQQSVGGDVAELKFYERVLSKLDQENITAQQMRALLQNVGKRTKFGPTVETGDQAILKKLYATVKSDLDEGIGQADEILGSALQEANAAYAEGMEILQGRLVRGIQNLGDRPDKVFEILTRPSTSIEDLRRIMDFIPDEDRLTVQASFINYALNRATTETGKIRGTVMQSLLRNFGPEKLETILDPAQIRTLNEISSLSLSLAKGQKIMDASQTAFLARLFAEISLVFTNPLVGLKVIAADQTLSRFILSDRGRKFLLEGFDDATMESITRMTEQIRNVMSPATTGTGSQIMQPDEIEESQ